MEYRYYCDIDDGIKESIRFFRCDTDIKIYFIFAKDGKILDLTNETIRMFMYKANGDKVFADLTIEDPTNGLASLQMTEQYTNVAGALYCDFTLYNSDSTTKSTPRFLIKIVNPLRDDIDITSTSEYRSLTDALNLVNENNELVKQLNKRVKNIGSGAPKAVYNSLTELTLAYPLGDDGTFLVGDNWAYWNEENKEWTIGGLYQSIVLDDETLNSKIQQASELVTTLSSTTETCKTEIDEKINEVNTTYQQWDTEFSTKYSEGINSIEDAKTDSYGNVYTSLKERLDSQDLVLYMPLPSTVEENTRIFQKYLDFAKNNNRSIEIRFKAGTYDLNTCIMYSNTTIKLGMYTTLNHVRTKWLNTETNKEGVMNPFLLNAKPFDETDSNITGYEGNSNISILGAGGTIKAYNPFVLVHGKNIYINRVNFEETKSEHIFQIGGCKDVTIEDCTFNGIAATSEDRNYVEMIQLDYMTYVGLPYWKSTSAFYDNTPNDNIVVKRCEFNKGTGDYAYIKTCIGSHSVGVNRNKNILIENCDFNNYEYCGLNIRNMDNVYVENCRFNSSQSSDPIKGDSSYNININNCSVNGGNRLLAITNIDGLTIDNIKATGLTHSECYLLIGESNTISLNNINFKSCTGGTHNILLRNCVKSYINNCSDDNTTNSSGYFVKAYTKDDGISKDIVVQNLHTTKLWLNPVNTTNIICQDYTETIFEGTATEGDILLSESIDNFQNTRIVFSFYGTIDTELSFYNDRFIINKFNMDDSLSKFDIYFLEGSITKTSSTVLKIDYFNMLSLANNTVTKIDNYNTTVIKIYGKRRRFKE